MRNIMTIIGKELKTYFVSPIAYVVVAVFLVVVGFLFYNIVSIFSNQSVQFMRFQGFLPQVDIHAALFRPTFLNMSVVLLLVMPILTMRLFSEEKKARTTELLMTSPVSILEIVLGKYFASLIVFVMMLLLTLPLPLFVSQYAAVQWSTLWTNYLGIFFVGSVFLAFGLFASSYTENQIIAAVISFGIFLILWLLRFASQNVGASPLGDFLSFLAVVEHLDNFLKGVIDTRDVAYFLSSTILGIFLTHRVVESQRWK